MLIAVGMIVSWVVCYGVLLVAFAWSVGEASQEPSDAVYVLAAAVALFGPGMCVWYLDRWRYARFARKSPYRTARLRGVVLHPKSKDRYPHRIVERQFRQRAMSARAVRRLLRELAPGHVIFANGPTLVQYPRPAPNDVVFEPIDIEEDHEQMMWLARLNLEEQGDHGWLEATTAEPQGRFSVRDALRGFWPVVNGVAWIVWVVFAVSRGYSLAVLLCIAVPILLATLAPLFIEERWWLVPGALVRREARLWRGRPTLQIFTNDDASLFLDIRSDVGLVFREGRAHRFPCEGFAAWVIVAGWVSRARRPTERQIRMLLVGPHAAISGRRIEPP